MGAFGIQSVYIGKPLLWPQNLNGATATSQTFDIQTLGIQTSRALRITLFAGPNGANAPDVSLTALKIQGSNTSGSGYVDVTGAVFGTSLDVNGATSALPNAAALNHGTFGFLIDTAGGAYRYYQIVVTAGSGTYGVDLFALVEADRLAEMVSPDDVAQGYTGGLLVAPPFLTTH